ncbi:ParA family protein [Methylobacterium sp. WL30]|uniref:ParA family protein n=1 Tax=unclassified Methylobacterium TaxID=2615210 RepID=UPI0011CB8A9D|nr:MULTISPECIES: ParA family protein [unclassified Methylobacterium]TXN27892.1 ParA family protein [Methylobacterium sp. WL93]TXN45664.1 ParA family protein [Methylobacterium sp. WL119]TXN62617.1 ParA family protein [Methylobacterium sp. WL30]
MYVLAIVSQKGGTGKSTLAISLAVAAEEQGLKTSIIDIDPQGTTKKWYIRREAETGPEVNALSVNQLEAAMPLLQKQGVQLVIIDTPGADVPGVPAAIQLADLCLIPARPSVADIEASAPTVSAIHRLGKLFSYVLNQCPPGRSIRTTDAFRVLQLTGAVASTSLALRADHMDALATGQGVTERDPNSKAAGEIRELLAWTLNRMEGKPHGQKQTRVA